MLPYGSLHTWISPPQFLFWLRSGWLNEMFFFYALPKLACQQKVLWCGPGSVLWMNCEGLWSEVAATCRDREARPGYARGLWGHMCPRSCYLTSTPLCYCPGILGRHLKSWYECQAKPGCCYSYILSHLILSYLFVLAIEFWGGLEAICRFSYVVSAIHASLL